MRSKLKNITVFLVGFSTISLFFINNPIGSCQECDLISFQDAAAVYLLLKEDENKLSLACVDNSNSRCIEFYSGSYNSNSPLCSLYISNSTQISKCENAIAKCVISKLSSTVYYPPSWTEANSELNCREINGEFFKI